MPLPVPRMSSPNRLPREIAPGVHWIGDCTTMVADGKICHGYNSAFLVAGETASCLVDTGHPKDYPIIKQQLSKLFARGAPPLKYLFVTHQEKNHHGNFGRLVRDYPEINPCGDVSYCHPLLPQYEDRILWMRESDEIDLGGRMLAAIGPVISDMPSTLWGFDTRERVLFSADGFAYSHEDTHCGLTAEEAVSLNLREAASMFAEGGLLWERTYHGRFNHLIQRLGIKTIAPTHGLPVTNVKGMMAKIGEERTGGPD